jgi:hypothetical protein
VGHFLNEKHRQRIVGLLGELGEESTERAYSELLSGIIGLGIRWEDINVDGKQNLLNQLEALKSKLTVGHICPILFNYGKLKVKLKESPYKKTVLELVMKSLKEIEKDNGQGKLDLPRVVSVIVQFTSFFTFLVF